MRQISPPERERLTAALDFWRMIEAFAPDDLSQHAEGRSPSRPPLWLTADRLEGRQEGLPFPELGDGSNAVSGFRLFVGIFDQTEIDRLSRGLHNAAASEFEESERRQPSSDRLSAGR